MPERVKAFQRNWIGRSEGLEFSMEIETNQAMNIQVLTTRPEHDFRQTFVALAPQHPRLLRVTHLIGWRPCLLTRKRLIARSRCRNA